MNSPLLKGGQGRSSRDVHADGTALALTILAGLLVLVALVLRECAS